MKITSQITCATLIEAAKLAGLTFAEKKGGLPEFLDKQSADHMCRLEWDPQSG